MDPKLGQFVSRGATDSTRSSGDECVPFPFQTAWLVTCLEVFGGAAVLVGLFVTILSIPLIISMLVTIFTVQGRFGFSSVNTIGLTPPGPVFGPPGYEINLLNIAGLVALAFSGPTALSVDRVLARAKAVDR
jgi:putative oxidoreductase